MAGLSAVLTNVCRLCVYAAAQLHEKCDEGGTEAAPRLSDVENQYTRPEVGTWVNRKDGGRA